MENKPNFTLEQIANWAEKDEVALPNVQRGFVWKAAQIENLWDSLLRGYPVGSFVLSPKKNAPDKFEMLDGQQRATAICLGFEKKTFREETKDHYKLFIDLELPKPGDMREFIFRVITKSHPWGYSRTENSKTLSADDKRDAMEIYKKDDWLNEDLDSFFPYDASLSVPFNFFIDSAIADDTVVALISKIEMNWKDKVDNKMWPIVKNLWYKWIKENITDRNEEDASDKRSLEIDHEIKIHHRIAAIYAAVKKMLETQKIPALYLDFELLKQRQMIAESADEITDSKESEDQGEDIESIKQTDAIENLFIRLNSGGTILNGEDLNYSILKSGLKNDKLIKLIESACKDFIQPSRFITLAFKLYQKEKSKTESLSMRINPKQFQKTINEILEDESFETYVGRLISEKKYLSMQKTLLEYACYILEYNKNGHENGLPHLIVCKIARASPEIMFMLLYRLKHFKEEFEYGKENHCRALGLITILMWLGKGEKQRDHAKVLTNIWPAIETLPTDKFWSSATVQRALLNNVLTPLPSFKKIKEGKLLLKLIQSPKSNTSMWDRINKNSNFYDFVHKILLERDIVVYAQREFLSGIFKNQEYHQEDTNMPFDWDHISPSKFIYSKKGIPKIIKECYGTIGNLRAWPYALNRTDQAVSPALKFDPTNKIHYADYKADYIKGKESWQKFVNKNKDIIQDISQLKSKLLLWSYCNDKRWLELDSVNMKNNWQPTYELIMHRNFAIIKHWYEALYIEDLLNLKVTSLGILLNKSKWKLINKKTADKELKDALIDEDYDVWICKHISPAIKINSFLFLQFSKSEVDILSAGNVVFGIYCSKQNDFVSSIKIVEKNKNAYSTNLENYIYGNFTLISHNEESYRELIKDIEQWLNEFPCRKVIKAAFAKSFLTSIINKFKN